MNFLKRCIIFATFFTCCVCIALVAASLATTHWLVATCNQYTSDGHLRLNSSGYVHFGLFHGTKALNVGFGERISHFTVTAPTDTEGLLDQGLWGGTIGCLSGGLIFSVIASIFAIINTVTTPVEALTGITGLYVWNGIAAFLELVAMILWLVEFSTHLSHNVLIVDAQQGWTTEGNEVLGISFWLVVVSIIIHIANCGVIAYGTYEPKAKDKIQAPDKATNDILLY